MELFYALPIVFKLSMPIDKGIFEKFKINFQKRQHIERIIPEHKKRNIHMRFDTCV